TLILAVVALPAVVPLVGLWLFRVLLESLYKAINFQNLSLLRQMEFNADLVAASVTGSDALVHVLFRLQFATETLAFTRDDLASAPAPAVYPPALSSPKTGAPESLRPPLKPPQGGNPPLLPEDPSVPSQLFRPENRDVLPMWATHPSHYEREQ